MKLNEQMANANQNLLNALVKKHDLQTEMEQVNKTINDTRAFLAGIALAKQEDNNDE